MQFSIYQTINVLLSFNRLEILGFLIDLKKKNGYCISRVRFDLTLLTMYN